MASSQDVEKTSIDFLYVNANAGEAAGGHTALRLGDSIFHYQFFPDSTFLLVREPWVSFRFLYNNLHNRTISIASFPLDPASFTTINQHFTELLIAQQLFFQSLELLQAEVDLMQLIGNGKGQIAIPGLGFFTDTDADSVASACTTTLHQTIATELGQEFLSQATQQAAENTRQTFTALNLEAEEPRQTILEALIWQEALHVLQDHSCLDTRAVIQPMPGEQTLTPFEQEQLQHFNNGQRQSILALLHSARPDKGKALLLQTARYLAVRHSLKTQQLYTLDPFPDNARTVKLTEKEIQTEPLALLQTDLQKKAAQRAHLFFQEKNHPEIAYSLLETSRARAWELIQAGEQGHEIRLLPKVKLPSRAKKIALHHFQTEQPGVSATSQRLEQKLKMMQKMAKKRYGYNLFYRNCATALIQSLNNSFPDQATGQTMLGGWMEPNSGFVFIPFLFYEESRTTFPLQEEQVLPARRLRNLEELYANENNLLVWLRESNTLSSTLYEPRSKDTPFLFFTDDSLLLRPIQGIVNFSYATLHGVVGIITLPFDGGERLHQAGRGMFYSLPEITFSNIRKGSYATGEHLE